MTEAVFPRVWISARSGSPSFPDEVSDQKSETTTAPGYSPTATWISSNDSQRVTSMSSSDNSSSKTDIRTGSSSKSSTRGLCMAGASFYRRGALLSVGCGGAEIPYGGLTRGASLGRVGVGREEDGGARFVSAAEVLAVCAN